MHRLYLVPTLLINVVIIFIPAALTIALAARFDTPNSRAYCGIAGATIAKVWSNRKEKP